MGWEFVTTLTVSREWQVSPPVAGEIFRIVHTTLLRGDGLVCQALQNGSQLSTYDVRSMYANVEPEIFSFLTFAGMTDRRIAVKSLVQDAVPWTIVIERYVLEDNPDNHPVLLGTLTAALANLVTGDELAASIATRATVADLAAAIADKVTSAQLAAALATKQSTLTLTAQTSDAVPTDMVIPQRILIPPNSSAGYEIQLIAQSMGSPIEFVYWLGSGAFHRRAAASSTVLQNSTTTRRSSAGNGSSWVISTSADTINGGLRLQVKGEAGKTIKWVASVKITEVS